MNNGRIWCVVSPTVGLPAFLGSVALISFTVHFAVLNNSTWVGDFFQGKAKKTAAAEIPAGPAVVKAADGTSFVVAVTPVALGQGHAGTAFVVSVTPQEAATAVSAVAPKAEHPPGSYTVAVNQTD